MIHSFAWSPRRGRMIVILGFSALANVAEAANDKINNESLQTIRILVPSISVSPQFPVFEFQYREFAIKNPLAHKALLYSIRGDDRSAGRILDVLNGRDTLRNVARFVPDISASLSIAKFEAKLPVGSQGIGVSASLGPSVSATLKTGDAIVGYYSDKNAQLDNLERLAIASSPAELKEAATFIASLGQLNNSKMDQKSAPYTAATLNFMDVQQKLQASTGEMPIWARTAIQQIETMAAGQGSKFKEQALVKKLLKLPQSDLVALDKRDLSPDQKLQRAGISRKELEDLATTVPGLGEWANALKGGTGIPEALAAFVRPYLAPGEARDSRVEAALNRYDKEIARANALLATAANPLQRAAIEGEAKRLESDKAKLEARFNLDLSLRGLETFRAEVQGLVQIASLFDVKFANEFGQRAEAAVSAIEGATKIFYGEVSFSSVGQVVAGLQGLLGKKVPSANDVINSKLDLLIQHTRMIIESLTVAQKKLDFLLTQTSEIHDLLNNAMVRWQDNFEYIEQTLGKIEKQLGDQRNQISLSARDQSLSALNTAINLIEETLTTRWNKAQRAEITDYLSGKVKQVPASWPEFDARLSFIAKTIADDSLTNSNFRPQAEIGQISTPAQVAEFARRPASIRTGYLPSIYGSFGLRYDGDMPNFDVVSRYSTDYAKVLGRLPASAVNDSRIAKVCEMNLRVEATGKDARGSLEFVVPKFEAELQSRIDRIGARMAYGAAELIKAQYIQLLSSIASSRGPSATTGGMEQLHAGYKRDKGPKAQAALDGAFKSITEQQWLTLFQQPSDYRAYNRNWYRILRASWLLDRLETPDDWIELYLRFDEFFQRQVVSAPIDEIVSTLVGVGVFEQDVFDVGRRDEQELQYQAEMARETLQSSSDGRPVRVPRIDYDAVAKRLDSRSAVPYQHDVYWHHAIGAKREVHLENFEAIYREVGVRLKRKVLPTDVSKLARAKPWKLYTKSADGTVSNLRTDESAVQPMLELGFAFARELLSETVKEIYSNAAARASWLNADDLSKSLVTAYRGFGSINLLANLGYGSCLYQNSELDAYAKFLDLDTLSPMAKRDQILRTAPSSVERVGPFLGEFYLELISLKEQLSALQPQSSVGAFCEPGPIGNAEAIATLRALKIYRPDLVPDDSCKFESAAR